MVSTVAAPPVIGTGSIDLLIADGGAPFSVLAYPLALCWPGHAGSRVWWRVDRAAQALYVTVQGGDPIPNPPPLIQPGPDWQSATIMYLRNAPTAWIVSDQRIVWSPFTQALTCPLAWDAGSDVLIVALPS